MSDVINEYVDSFGRTHVISEALESFADLEKTQNIFSIAGRIMAKRTMGNIIFFDVQDGSGKIQCCGSKKILGESLFGLLKKDLKIGDLVGLSGSAFHTRTAEKTINLANIELLSKSMRELPEKYHGLVSQELQYRQRYLGLIMDYEVRDVFQQRSLLIRNIRRYLEKEGFTEVEIPVLQKNPCGASANPFKTRHNALDADLYLRISPETFLKQLVVGGMEKVFDIGKNFRNEGLDPSHLQEFTMLEYYVSYWNYLDNLRFIEEMLKKVIKETAGTLCFTIDEKEIDFSAEWKVVTFRDLVLKDSGVDVLKFSDVQALKNEMREKGIEIKEDGSLSLGNLIDKLYKKMSRPNLVQPTILLNHPACLIPLARRNQSDPRIVDSFQLVVNGWEVAKAYSELADPVLQRQLLEEQSRLREAGDEEAMFVDEDFLTSLEYGMPPVSGLGLGIDRLVSIITGQSNLKDVILFPLMK
jgi:lysyl-tRNA synthetase class 2